MPLQYKKKTNRRVASTEDIQSAIREILEEKKSLRETALKYDIPKSSLARYVLNKDKLPGSENQFKSKYVTSQIFSIKEENLLIEYILTMSKIHYGLTKTKTREIAYQFAVANKKKIPNSWEENKLAGLDWLRGFLKRNQSVSLRKPEATSLSRATSFNKKNVSDFYGNLEEVLKRHKFEPQSIYNVDETAVKTVQNTSYVLAQKGAKLVGQMTSSERGQLVTMVLTINAQGNFIPPFYVFPRHKFKENLMLKGATPGASGAANPSGWMSGEIFPKFLEHFVKYSKPTKENPVLIIMDNHESHITVESITFAKENGIVIVTLPPHCSHRLQPLDVAVFAPLKAYYNRVIDSWLASNPGRTISIYEVAELSGQAFTNALTPKNIQAGFKKCGIHPFNKDTFSDDDFVSAYVTDRPDPNPQSTVISIDEVQPSTSAEDRPMALTPNAEHFKTNEDVSMLVDQPNLTITPVKNKLGNITTPEQIKPYPKAGARKKSNRGKKPGRTRILTDTPEKLEIEKDHERKKINLIKKNGKEKKTLKRDKKERLANDKEKKRIRSDIVRSSSESDISVSSGESIYNILEDEELAEVELLEVEPENLKQGTFVLVEFKGGSRQSTKYKYVCIVQRPPEDDPEEETEISVMALKSFDDSKKLFIPKEEDISFVSISSVLGILPSPRLIMQGDRVRYSFEERVAVFEK